MLGTLNRMAATLALLAHFAACSSGANETPKQPGKQPNKGDLWVSPDTGIEFMWIPPGTFRMGSPETEAERNADEIQHSVTLTKGFWMGKYEVTQGQWKKFTGQNPSHFKYAGDNAPIENISWYTCEEFINKLNALAKEGTKYRFPTEAEWEYACRAGSESAIYTGALTIKAPLNGPELDAIACYGGNSGAAYPGAFDTRNWRDRQHRSDYSGTRPVGQKRPNAFGLHDMIGNVWEWCYDVYGEYPTGSVTDPVIDPNVKRMNPETKELEEIKMKPRVIRGACWYRIASGCRSAARHQLNPHTPGENQSAYVGLRLVCERN